MIEPNNFRLFYNYLAIFLAASVPFSESGPNNLHVNDGATTAEIISGDVFFEVIEPSELGYTYRIRPAKDFGATFNNSFYMKNVPLVPIIPKFGCSLPENRDDVEGNVALVERGECSFKIKAFLAEKAGAQAVIITDIAKTSEDYFIEMIDDASSFEVNIPVAFLMGKNGAMIKQTLRKLNRKYAIINLPVNITFTPLHKINQPPWLGW